MFTQVAINKIITMPQRRATRKLRPSHLTNYVSLAQLSSFASNSIQLGSLAAPLPNKLSFFLSFFPSPTSTGVPTNGPEEPFETSSQPEKCSRANTPVRNFPERGRTTILSISRSREFIRAPRALLIASSNRAVSFFPSLSYTLFS